MISINIFYISVLIHILSAIAWLGSLVALIFIVIPAYIKRTDVITKDLLVDISKRYIVVVQASSALILITGLYQTFDIQYLDINKLFFTIYGNLILLKILLYFVFVIIGIRTGLILTKVDNLSKENIEKLVQKAKIWLFIDLGIGIFIVIIALSLSINVQFSF